MVINLKQLFDITGEKELLQYNLVMEEPSYKGMEIQMPIAISGVIQNRAGVVTLEYSCLFSLKTQCDRCLEDVCVSYDKSFEHILIKSLESEASQENDDFLVCESASLDFDNLAVTDIFLSLPTKILCDSECKGLCGSCGTNLNKSECNCKANKINPGVKTLGDLF